MNYKQKLLIIICSIVTIFVLAIGVSIAIIINVNFNTTKDNNRNQSKNSLSEELIENDTTTVDETHNIVENTTSMSEETESIYETETFEIETTEKVVENTEKTTTSKYETETTTNKKENTSTSNSNSSNNSTATQTKDPLCNLSINHDYYIYEKAYRHKDVSGLSSDEVLLYNVLKEVLDYAYTYKTPQDRAKAVHDWLVLNTYADINYNDISRTIEGVLLYKTGLCKGYADTYQLCMDILGIECRTIIGYAYTLFSYGGHVWNAIKLDGEWYHVDVTWDDPYPDTGNISYDYFNITDEQISINHEYTFEYKCNGIKYNYFNYFYTGEKIVNKEQFYNKVSSVIEDSWIWGTKELDMVVSNSIINDVYDFAYVSKDATAYNTWQITNVIDYGLYSTCTVKVQRYHEVIGKNITFYAKDKNEYYKVLKEQIVLNNDNFIIVLDEGNININDYIDFAKAIEGDDSVYISSYEFKKISEYYSEVIFEDKKTENILNNQYAIIFNVIYMDNYDGVVTNEEELILAFDRFIADLVAKDTNRATSCGIAIKKENFNEIDIISCAKYCEAKYDNVYFLDYRYDEESKYDLGNGYYLIYLYFTTLRPVQ